MQLFGEFLEWKWEGYGSWVWSDPLVGTLKFDSGQLCSSVLSLTLSIETEEAEALFGKEFY